MALRQRCTIFSSGAIANVTIDNNNGASFKFKTKIAGKTENDGTKMLKLEYHQNI